MVPVRGIFFEEDDARAVAARLVGDGWEADVRRERLAGEDDDEDHPWAVLTDAPAFVFELLVDQHEGWLDDEETGTPDTPAPPLDLPTAPKRVKRPGAGPGPVEGGHYAGAMTADQRLLLVHAHPDDESIGQGATMAKYVAEGRGVTLVTCTAGEMGEILQPGLEHLAADRDDTLGEHRQGELADAMAALGVTDYRFLGGFGTYRDSGMQWHEDGHAVPADDLRPNAFWLADLTEAADHLVRILREVRPQVLITYDQFGGYGHPDHIQAHRVATYAAHLAAVPSYQPELGEPWEVAKIYWGAMSESRMRASLRALRDAGDMTTFEGMDPDGPLPHFITPDEHLAAMVDGTEYLDQKMAALAAHRTQITLDGPFFALSNNQGNSVWATEFYRLAKGTPGPTNDEGLETDLFAGL